MNHFTAIGRIGRNAVTRYSAAGKPVTGWSIAVDSGFGDKKQTVWMDCAIFGERGEKLAASLIKGERIGVSGELGTREHEGKTYITLNVREVTLLGEKREVALTGRTLNKGSSECSLQSVQNNSRYMGGTLDDDIPFSPRAKRNHWD